MKASDVRRQLEAFPLLSRRRCIVCEASLDGRRVDAKTCGRRCRQALARNGGQPPADPGEAVTPPLLRALRVRVVSAVSAVDTARRELGERRGQRRALAFVRDAREELAALLVDLDAAIRESWT